MKNILLNNWNFFRILRLILGVVIIVQNIYAKNWLMSLLGLLFAYTALFNIGCCGSSECYTSSKPSLNNKKEIEYEEVV